VESQCPTRAAHPAALLFEGVEAIGDPLLVIGPKFMEIRSLVPAENAMEVRTSS